MSTWELYFLLKLDDIQNFFEAITVVSGIITGVTIIVLTMENKWKTRWKFLPIILLTITLSFSILETLIPSTKQMAAIIVVPAIVNNEKIQELPNEIMELLGMSIDKAKEILQPEKLLEKKNE